MAPENPVVQDVEKPIRRRAKTGVCSIRRPELALVVAVPNCRIGFANDDARRRLARFFARPRKAGTLPPEICRWLAVPQASRRPLLAVQGQSRLIVRRVAVTARDAIALTLELVPALTGPRSAPDQRLTSREHEVLHWLAEGKPTSLIAAILHLSERTVSKHIEHILQKLGVETRTAAVASYLNGAARKSSRRSAGAA